MHLLKAADHRNEPPVQRQAREIIERQVGNLAKIVGDLLEVSRVISGRLRLELAPVDLNDTVRQAAETAGPLIGQRGHTLVLRPWEGSDGEERLLVRADPTRLEQVFVNLINNAAKYTPEGGEGRIEVVCEREREGNQELAVVRVLDNGEGIDSELLPRLFDLFSQADRSLARSQGGLGIGLALADNIVKLHGGTIRAASAGLGKGSEFTVALPLMDTGVLPEAAGDQSGGVSVPQATAPVEGSVRVLVVDDNYDQALMLSENLRQHGYSVQMARSGPDGLRVVQQWRPDIVLMDIGLPGMSGYDVARMLRADPVLAAAGVVLRLIALTGYGSAEDVMLATEAGFDAHLVKPVDFQDVVRAIGATSR